MTEPKYHHSAIDRLPVVETDTPPSAEQITEEVAKSMHKAAYFEAGLQAEWPGWENASELTRASYRAKTDAAFKTLSDAGKIIVDKDELQDICNAIAVGDQASAWEKLTSMIKDTGS